MVKARVKKKNKKMRKMLKKAGKSRQKFALSRNAHVFKHSFNNLGKGILEYFKK
jgi:hypothetical protein